MGTTLYIWPAHAGNVGHASMLVGKVYMSYWPGSQAGKSDFKIGATHPPSFPREYRTDARLEKREAQYVMQFDYLAEAAMIAAWEELRAHCTQYNMVKHNCSTVIAALLQVGSGIAPPFVPTINISAVGLPKYLQLSMQLRFLGNKISMWSPEAVAEYGRQIHRQRRQHPRSS